MGTDLEIAFEQPLRILLAMFTHVGAAAPWIIIVLDTQWIWQEGRECLRKDPIKIVGVKISLPASPD